MKKIHEKLLKNGTIPIPCRVLSIIVVLFVLAIIISIFLNVVVYIYYLKNPMSKGQDDLGIGFVMMFYSLIAFVCAVIIFYPIYKVVLKKILKLAGANND
jgi:hypothetical protein